MQQREHAVWAPPYAEVGRMGDGDDESDDDDDGGCGG